MSSLLLPLVRHPSPPDELADRYRVEISQKNKMQRETMGQYLTPVAIARFMASLFNNTTAPVRLLDPGAGTGILTGAFVQEMAGRPTAPSQIHAFCYELDPAMRNYLDATLTTCQTYAKASAIAFASTVMQTDFIRWGADKLSAQGSFFEEFIPQFTHCIMNPPYKKIRNDSQHRAWLRKIGIETSNLYSGFLAVALQLLAPGGELVAIIPRSFCNGPYFRAFRRFLLQQSAIRQLHIFEDRDKIFASDHVLQENVILHVIKGQHQEEVLITSSSGDNFDELTWHEVSLQQIVKPDDENVVIHIPASHLDQWVVDRVSVFTSTLSDLAIEVSTGPVVEFRQKKHIKQDAVASSHPLIYPSHFENGFVRWPNERGKKPNAIVETETNHSLFMPNGWYVLTKRFSSKEERRRVVAALHHAYWVAGQKIGFENHLNVFHKQKQGLEPSIAKGLAVYLNSTLLDLYFRQFSGHTQVNATDLRALRYPDADVLRHLAKLVGETFPAQDIIDQALDEVIDTMTVSRKQNPLPIRRRIQEALSILNALKLPKKQQNERSALTLLALVGLKPEMTWQEAQAPKMGITPIISFISTHYGKQYAPNTREAIRRQTMHQFVEAGIAVPNPDAPTRPVNSPKWHYQIAQETLDLLRLFGTEQWHEALQAYRKKQPSLAMKYKKQRAMQMIPLQISADQVLQLSPGEHNQLIKDIIEKFGPRFAPEAKLLYVGDTSSKMILFDKATFDKLGLTFDVHGKFPDVVLYLPAKNWLYLIEAVTSHGPVNAKRHIELASLFASAQAALIYVTAFPDRHLLARHLPEISWETEVWMAESPSHIIHFDGERFLGPYPTAQ